MNPLFATLDIFLHHITCLRISLEQHPGSPFRPTDLGIVKSTLTTIRTLLKQAENDGDLYREYAVHAAKTMDYVSSVLQLRMTFLHKVTQKTQSPFLGPLDVGLLNQIVAIEKFQLQIRSKIEQLERNTAKLSKIATRTDAGSGISTGDAQSLRDDEKGAGKPSVTTSSHPSPTGESSPTEPPTTHRDSLPMDVHARSSALINANTEPLAA